LTKEKKTKVQTIILKILNIQPYTYKDTTTGTFHKTGINSGFAEGSAVLAPLVIYHLTWKSCRTLVITNNI
jgi:hypothetical protein